MRGGNELPEGRAVCTGLDEAKNNATLNGNGMGIVISINFGIGIGIHNRIGSEHDH